MNKYGFYTRAVTAQLQDMPMSPFVPHREFQFRKRSSSVAENRFYRRVDKTLEKDFARKCMTAFHMGNQARSDKSELDADNLLGYQKSLLRISSLDLDSTLEHEHRLKRKLPKIESEL